MNRRKFIQDMGLLASSLAISYNGVSLNTAPSLFSFRTKHSNGKIMVLIQLFGGNDGLNTVIPFEDDIYHKSRPTLRVRKRDVLRINNEIGFHPEMVQFQELFKEGKLSIIQNVGYENPNRSHFRSTDIWKSGSDSEEYIYNGWTARYLDKRFEDYANLPYPPAIELGWGGSMLIENNANTLGIYLDSPNEYYSLTNGNNISEYLSLGNKVGDALDYINSISKSSFKFSSIIKDVADRGKNVVSYPDTFLGKQLSIIAQFISGGLETPVYIAKLKGFDTHFNQVGSHDALLKEVSDAVGAFQKDIDQQSLSDKITTFVFSEFGRRVKENASGTDHGTAAPVFVLGNTVRGGIIGKNPNLSDLDNNGDLKYKYDFRQIYSTILNDHLETSITDSNSILFKEYSSLPIFQNSVPAFQENAITLEQNFPNPVKANTTIGYFLTEGSFVKIFVIDTYGKTLTTLVNKFQLSGQYYVDFDATYLPIGLYFYSIYPFSSNSVKKMIKE